MKKNWEKPELIILYRARPEEAILTHCKHANDTPLTPAIIHDNCNDTGQTTCGACSSNANQS